MADTPPPLPSDDGMADLSGFADDTGEAALPEAFEPAESDVGSVAPKPEPPPSTPLRAPSGIDEAMTDAGDDNVTASAVPTPPICTPFGVEEAMTDAGDDNVPASNAPTTPPTFEDHDIPPEVMEDIPSPEETARVAGFGNSILGNVKPPQSKKDMMLDRQRKFVQRFRQNKPDATPEDPIDSIETPDPMEMVEDEIEMPPPPLPAAKKPNQKREDPEYDESDYDDFLKLERRHGRRQAAGTMSVEEDIEFMKLKAMWQARLLKKAADEAYERSPELSDHDDEDEDESDDGLFVNQKFSSLHSDDDDETPVPKVKGKKRKAPATSSTVGPFGSDDESEATAPKPKKPCKTPKNSGGKKGKRVGGQLYTDEDLDNIMKSAKASRDGRSESTQATTSTTSKRGGKKSTAKKGGGRARKDPMMTNLNSLKGTDVFGDTAKVANLRDQPKFKPTKRRDHAFKELLASIPDNDKHGARGDQKYLDDAIKDFTGHASVKPADDGNWSVKGMNTTLKHYQILGVAFMRRRENSAEQPRGGILADQMGLGKTIMMLTNIINGKADERTKWKTTLIVAAPALVTQWDAEISKHCQFKKENKKYGLGKVLQYRSGNRVAGTSAKDVLEECDIMLTTYHEVNKSYPKAIPPPHLTTAKQKDDWWKKFYEEEKGMIHQMKFHRVVLDEAQAIKNHKGQTSMACRAIRARHYWAITGTPIMNSIKEFYPYFKFLREPNTGSYKIFKENFCSPDDPEGIEKLNVFLRKVMIRRTHLDTLFNARLLDLPQPKQHTQWLEFNEIERSIYEIVKNRMIIRINTISKQEGVEKQYSHIWTMILRLRQLCGHILLLQGVIIDLLEREDFEKLEKIAENEEDIGREGTDLLLNLRHVLAHHASTNSVNNGVGDAVVTSGDLLPNRSINIDATQAKTLGGKHGQSYHIRRYLQQIFQSDQWEEIVERGTCCACRQLPMDPQITSCFHLYCKACVTDMMHLTARRGHDATRCSQCGMEFTYVKAVEDPHNFQDTQSSRSGSQEGEDSPNSNSKKRASKKKGQQKDEMEDWLGLPGEMLPSAKTSACKAQILNWLDETPKAKIIIFTQFLPIVRIMAKVCRTEKWKFVRYTGEDSHETREKAIGQFRDNPETKIMLASLRCGGLGLNLTMATRVICFDPWWNEAVEQQAFCRVFRIGQTEETRMTRFVIKNTIDAAMMQMKERKQIDIDKVMASNKKPKDVKDLLRLFGPVAEDEGGRPFIYAEPGEDDEEPMFAESDSEDERGHMGNDG